MSANGSFYSYDPEDEDATILAQCSSMFRKFANSMLGTPYTRIRKIPIKVEPKVFFANERTFLSWMNMSVTLASISLAILSFGSSGDFSQFYGLVMLPVAVAFCVYALYTYLRRGKLIRDRAPGPYEDTRGPIVLCLLLSLAIVINFTAKLLDLVNKNS